jgi:hypothetical protein
MARPVDIEHSANSAHLEWIGSTEQDPLYILMQREALDEDRVDSPEDNAIYYFNDSPLTNRRNSSTN